MFVRAFRKYAISYLFLLPWFLGFLFLALIPFLYSLFLSFTDFDMFTAPEWVGLGNYKEMLMEDGRFQKALRVTFIYVFVGVPVELAVALLLALLMNKGIRGLSLYRAVYYIPYLFGGSVAIAVLWRKVFGVDGIFNQFLAMFGIQGISWIGTPSTAIYTLILLKVWQFGSPMIIFLAGLKQIPKELYEAASIDGAGRIGQFRSITLPLLSPIIFFNMIMQLVYSFQAFTPAYIVSNGTGGPVDSTLFYTLYLYEKGFTNFSMGYSSAMAWFLLMVIAFFSAIGFITSKKWVHYEG
ncbi:carbohydrate ABC transporter permease [Cohnella hongkongensis]|uniref:Carbohydrate ABC transporter permease n=1 Tax=Cohnella hongkongensis TaxID=178337 RepID=A0ABV9F7P1_9BACL